MAMRRETRLSTATIEASLDAALLEPIVPSLESVDLDVLFIFNICDQLRQLRTDVKIFQLSRPYKEANRQISSRKAG